MPQAKDAPLLADGGTIDDTRATVEVDELLATLGPMLKQVDPKDVAAIVHGLASTVEKEPDGLARIVRHAGDISAEVRDILQKNRSHIDQTAAGLGAVGKALDGKGPALARTVDNLDRVSGVLSQEAPGLARKATRIATRVEALTGAVQPQQVERLATHADQAMTRLPRLLEKADRITERDVRTFTHDVLMKTGLRVYLHPFTPPDAVPGPVPAEPLKP